MRGTKCGSAMGGVPSEEELTEVLLSLRNGFEIDLGTRGGSTRVPLRSTERLW